MSSGWEINLHEEVASWYLGLDGPALGRPLVDQITSSRHSHMKELRTGTVRILFAFDPARQAILLVAGDKRGSWNVWYRTAVPQADDRYDAWVAEQKGNRS